MAGRAALQFFEILLQNRWSKDFPGRMEPVPQPNITIAADEDISRVDFTNDQIFIRDGGPESHDPKGAGWTHRETETLVTLDLRTAHSRGRLEGYRDEETNEPEVYGGLRGEVLRIVDDGRKGEQEYDWINPYEWNDLSEEVGFGNWRGTWEIRLSQKAANIDPNA